MNVMYAKYGLQGPRFACLPDLNGYRLCKQNTAGLVTLDLKKELAALILPGFTLHITVPTFGFTDPLLDYAPVPYFAIPLSINGYVGDDKNLLAAKAEAWGVDITGSRYPLLRNHQHKIDYDLIHHRTKEPVLFTTLLAISYVFYADQLAQGTKACDNLTGMMEFLLCYKASRPMNFSVQVKNEQGQEILARDLCYYPSADAPSKATFSHDETIDCRVQLGDPFNYFRSRWVCDLQSKDNTLRLTYHAGLSYASTRELLEHLIPKESFFRQFAHSHSKHSTKNCYDRYTQYQTIYYEHILSSILDQSLPLMALQAFFNPDAHKEPLLEKIHGHWDDHDKAVFKPSKRLVTLEAFVDAVDELIALRDPLLNAKLHVPLKQEGEVFECVGVNVNLEDKEGHWCTIGGMPTSERATSQNVAALAKALNKDNYWRQSRK